MKVLFAMLLIAASLEANAQTSCRQVMNTTVCRDQRTGDEIHCRQVFQDYVCRNQRTGEETRCRQVFNEWVCR